MQFIYILYRHGWGTLCIVYITKYQIWTFILDRCVHENIWEINLFIFFISETKTNGKAYIFDCRYSTLCRQIVTDEEGRVQEFDFESDRPRVTLKGKIENSRFGNSIHTSYTMS